MRSTRGICASATRVCGRRAQGSAPRLSQAEEEQRDRNAILADAIAVFHATYVGRESVDGEPVLVADLKPRADARVTTREGRWMKHFDGQLWVAEADYQIVKIDMRAVDDITIGWGVVGRIHKGSRVLYSRRRFENAWLPAEITYEASGRTLIFRPFQFKVTTTYSDYRRGDKSDERLNPAAVERLTSVMHSYARPWFVAVAVVLISIWRRGPNCWRNPRAAAARARRGRARPGAAGPPERPAAAARCAGTQPLAVGTAIVSGTVVVAGTGQPARRARVTLNATEGGGSRTATTDEEGRYAFGELAAGRYSLSASKTGHVGVTYGRRGRAGPARRSSSPTGRSSPRDLQLPRGSVITGTVVDEYGEPTPGRRCV